MLKAIKVRLYPTYKQKSLLNQHFGAIRFLFNLGLEYKIMMYKDYGLSVSKFDLFKQISDLKKESTWLNNCKSECLQSAFDNLDSAYSSFFKGAGFPEYKNKKSKQSFVQKQNINIKDNRIKFLKTLINFKCSDRYLKILNSDKTILKRITYSRDKLNQYWTSILIETNHTIIKPKSNNKIGIDLGIKHFLVTSNGEFVDNPKYLKVSERKLRRLHKSHSRKKKGSGNREKSRLRIVKQYQKITNQRKDFLHKLSTKLISENQAIYLESLNIQGMIRNHKLAKSIQDVSWGEFVRMLSYKAEWNNREFHQIGRFQPSSKTCSSCGWYNKELTLRDRVFNCQGCGHSEDRDLNASKNILKFSRDELTRINASGELDNSHSSKEEKNVMKITNL